MTRLKLLVEGQTEETFVRELLAPHYAQRGLFIVPIVVRTSARQRGGMSTYAKVRWQLDRLCREDGGAWVSTLFDLYALPTGFPGLGDPACPPRGRARARFVEAAVALDIGQPRLIPNLVVHEFEALLFTAPQCFAPWTDARQLAALQDIASRHASPEDINDDPATAPSRRIRAVMPGYEKPFHGPLIAIDIGLDAMRERCAHFAGWLDRLDALAG